MSVKGEKYKSMSAMKKHEKSEGKKEMMMEYYTLSLHDALPIRKSVV